MKITLVIAIAAIAATALASDLIVADHRVWYEPWRSVTGPLVHATWPHLLRDVGLVLILGFAYERKLAHAWPWIVGLGLALPPIAVVASGDAGYYGLSGLAYAMLAAALAYETSRHPALIPIAIVFAFKVVYEAAAGPDATATSILPRGAWLALGPHVHQAPIAHLAGALGGLLGISHTAFRRPRRSRSSPAPRPTPA
ncbi:MAG TPA: rhomboid family intramembrane serine protease [Kofleriaceae bacterium]|nr:rhomboid family intramembrane serine protease [Kofleriaceae bacterium]